MKRYSSTYYSVKETKYTFELYDAEYTDNSSDCTLVNIELTWPGAETSDRFQTIIGSQMTVHLINNSSDIDTLISDIFSSGPDRFFAKLYKDDSLFWFGYLLHDNLEWDDRAKPYIFSLTFSDRLKILNEFDFELSTDDSNIVQVIIKCLQTAGVLEPFTSGTALLLTAINWWGSNHPTPAANKDPLFYTRVNCFVFRKREKDEDKPMTCYEVLNQICRIFGARIFLSDGMYQFRQVNEYASSSMYIRTYDKTQTLISYLTDNTRKLIDQSSLAKLGTHVFSSLPALKGVKIFFNKRNDNFIPSTFTTGSSASINVEAGDVLEICGYIEFEYKNASSVREKFYAKYQFKIDIDTTNFVKGDIYSNEWTTDSNDSVSLRCDIVMEGIDFEYFSIVTSPFPSSGKLTIQMSFDDYYNFFNSTFSPSGTFTLKRLFLTGYIYRNGRLIEETEFTATNNDADTFASYVYEVGKIIAGYGEEKDYGKFETSTDLSTWTAENEWSVGTGSENLPIPKLLAREILAGQKKPVLTCSGTVIGNFGFHNSFDYDSLVWVLQRLTYNTQQEQGSCEMFEVLKDTDSITETSDDMDARYDDSVLGRMAAEIKRLKDIWKAGTGESTERLITDVNTINIRNLPTSSSGLEVGDLYNDSGTIKIVTT